LIRLFNGQCSFSAWVDLRRAKLGAKSIGFDFAALPGWRAAQWVDDLVGAADLVIIDAAPHAEAYVRGGASSMPILERPVSSRRSAVSATCALCRSSLPDVRASPQAHLARWKHRGHVQPPARREPARWPPLWRANCFYGRNAFSHTEITLSTKLFDLPCKTADTTIGGRA